MSLFRRFLLLILIVLPLQAHGVEPAAAGKVLWVYDGDTIKVEGLGKVRLIGIDSPEKEDSERDRYYLRQGVGRERLRQVAREAHRFLVETARGQTVTLQTDRETRDRHGRLLAYVSLPDGRLLNRLLLERGLAAVYRKFEFRLKPDFIAAEQLARERHVGLWRK